MRPDEFFTQFFREALLVANDKLPDGFHVYMPKKPEYDADSALLTARLKLVDESYVGVSSVHENIPLCVGHGGHINIPGDNFEVPLNCTATQLGTALANNLKEY